MNDTSKAQFDSRAADAAYKSFPSFEEWCKTTINESKWGQCESILAQAKKADEDTLKKSQRVVQRMAAIETGAVEKLYETDQGFTMTVANELDEMGKMLSQRGEKTQSLLASQFSAYDFLLDFATKKEPLNVAWFRELHRVLCEGQKTYIVQTPQGPQEQPLPLGEYKSLPNHVIDRNDEPHSYAPVDLTPSEMQRLFEIFESETFNSANPIHQASFAQYALVVIHPFADGNGRASRALASVFSLRSNSIPFMVMAEDRHEYLSVLSAADEGNPQTFIDFVLERFLSTAEIIQQSLATAQAASVKDSMATLESLYTTSGGYSHEEVDTAGGLLSHNIASELQRLCRELDSKYISASVNATNAGNTNLGNPDYRARVNGQFDAVNFKIVSQAPANAVAEVLLVIALPKDCEKKGELLVFEVQNRMFAARMDQLHPRMKSELKIRIKLFAQQIFNQKMAHLTAQASHVMNR